MLTIDALKAWGANTDEGLSRCFNKEAFYLKLVNTIPNEKNFDGLAANVQAGDLQAAFENAHALKGVTSNLSLTPILTPVAEITELLRSGAEADYAAMVADILARRDELKAMCEG